MRNKQAVYSLALVLVLIGIGLSSSEQSTAIAQTNPTPTSAPESWRYRTPIIDRGRMSQLDNGFGQNCGHIGEGRYMDINGMDTSDEGYPVYASGEGTIHDVDYREGDYGNYVDLLSHGVIFRYAHLAKVYVTEGPTPIGQGDLIGLLGDTGETSTAPHLHWDAWIPGPNNTKVDYDGIYEIQNVEEFSRGTDPCTWPGTITAESLDVNHWYHPEGTSLDRGCPNYFNAEAEYRFAGLYHVTMFDHSNCLGNYKYIFAPGRYYLDDASDNPNDRFDNRMRSIYIPPGNPVLGIRGWSVRLYAYTDSGILASSCRTVDMWNMDQDFYEGSQVRIGWDTNYQDATNMVSRIDVFDNPTCLPPLGGLVLGIFTENGGIGGGNDIGPVASGDTVTVHIDPPYNGTRYGWHDPGKYNLADYMVNKVTSIGITSGWSIALFDGLDQTGSYICVSADEPDLSDNTLGNGTNANDRAESVIVFNNDNCSGMDLPDLVAEEVFVSLTTGTTTFEILQTGQPAYIDWHFTNKSNTAIASSFYVDLWINDRLYVHYPYSQIGSQITSGFDDWSVTVPHSGWLKVRLVVDPENAVGEIDEANNVWEKYFFWDAPNYLEAIGCSNVTDSGVILAQNASCGGNYEYLVLPGFKNLTTLNESVSAIRIPPVVSGTGISVMVYKNANRSGQKACFNGNIEDLSSLTWDDGSSMNDSISSFEVFFNEYCITQGSSVGQLVLYGGANYTGSATSLNLPGSYNLPSNIDNSMSSMDIASGWSAILYDGYNQSGSSICRNSDDLDFASDTYSDGTTLNNTVSSIELLNTPDCPLPPGVFNKSSPVNGLTNQQPSLTLSWGASNGATRYEYCYDTTNDNNCSWINNGINTTIHLSGLNTGTTYYWQVRSINRNGTTYANGNPNAFWSFTTAGATNSPIMTLNLGNTLGNRLVTIELRYPLFDQLSPSPFTWSTTTDANGNIINFPLAGANPGTAYNLLVKPQGWLRKQREATFLSGSNSVDMRSSFTNNAAGDINGDNRVNILDYQILSNTFGGTSFAADLNGDGRVNILDYQLLSIGFGNTGDGGEIIISNKSAAVNPANTAAGRLSLIPSTSNPRVGDVVTFDLNFDTSTFSMAALDALIDYDQCVFQPLVDQVTHSGVFATTSVISRPGTLEYAGLKWTALDPGPAVSGSGQAASIPFRVISSVPASTKIAIRFRPGSTYLSNMARDDVVQPILGGVDNAILQPTGVPQRAAQSAQVISPVSGETVNQDYVLLQAQVSDVCNGIKQVVFYVFYDGQWHPVSAYNTGTNRWAVYWNASGASDQVIRIKAFAGDFAGNGVESTVNSNIVLDRRAFADVPANYWARNYIERLYQAGITGGCGVNPLQYCPEGTVTRAQMAVFLERGIRGSSYNPPSVGGSTGFGDVPIGHWAAAWIKQLADDGITGGCGAGNYCPENPVTRAQMAVFLLRSKHGATYSPPAVGSGSGFSDVPHTYWSAAWIKQLVAEGITAGCGNGNYCPEAPVTRAQMAVFLVKTFNLP